MRKRGLREKNRAQRVKGGTLVAQGVKGGTLVAQGVKGGTLVAKGVRKWIEKGKNKQAKRLRFGI